MRINLLFLAAMVLCLAACGRHETPPSSSRPRATTGSQPATGAPRIISTVPAATLNLVLIGAVDSLVGVSPYDTLYLPEDKKNLPAVGDYNLETINYEHLISLKPTALIVQTAEAHIPARLRQLSQSQRFEIINIKMDTIEELWRTVRSLGRVAKREDAAETAVLKAQAELKKIAQSQAGKPRPKVVYVFSQSPLTIIGSDNFMHEMLTLAGAENLGAKIGRYPTISNETFLQLAPEVLLIGAPSQPDQQRNDDPRLESWRRYNIPTVKNNRVFLVTDPEALTASVNLPKSVRSLSTLIHRSPDAPPPSGGSAP